MRDRVGSTSIHLTVMPRSRLAWIAIALSASIRFRRNRGPERRWRVRNAASAAGLVDHELIQLSRYRVVAFLGSGSSAAVYKAHDKGLQRDVAIKVMHAHLLESPRASSLFLSEARTLAKLDHPGIVPIYDLGRTDDGRCYLVFKYIEGRSLEDRLNEGTVSSGAAADLVRTIAEALHAAHARGVVHRDVKPGTSCWMPAVGRSWPTSGWRCARPTSAPGRASSGQSYS